MVVGWHGVTMQHPEAAAYYLSGHLSPSTKGGGEQMIFRSVCCASCIWTTRTELLQHFPRIVNFQRQELHRLRTVPRKNGCFLSPTLFGKCPCLNFLVWLRLWKFQVLPWGLLLVPVQMWKCVSSRWSQLRTVGAGSLPPPSSCCCQFNEQCRAWGSLDVVLVCKTHTLVQGQTRGSICWWTAAFQHLIGATLSLSDCWL